MVLLSAQGTSVVRIAEVAFTSEDRVRDVIHNFNTDRLVISVADASADVHPTDRVMLAHQRCR
jgi:hypothetical protein